MADCLSVDNIAKLREVPSPSPLPEVPSKIGMVNVKGFSSIGDGGGGNFVWDPDSSAKDNNGTIIIPNGQKKEINGRWIRQFFEEINVRWFGAKGNSVAPDTDAIQAAWIATWDEKTNRVYRLIFPSGTYNITTLTSQGERDGMKWDLPSAYLEGIGKVIITSPNSLGKIIGGYATGINEIINFDKSCGPASITNIIFQGISTPDADFVQYSEGGAATLPSFFNPAGQNEPYNHRAGIHYQGTDAIICKNVEVSNMPYAGLLIDSIQAKTAMGDSGRDRQSLIEDSYFHGNGLYNIYVYPGVRDGNRVLQGGSIKLIHTRIENSIPVSWGYISYGINMGGCDFTAFDCDFVNNIGSGLSNDDINPSTMNIDSCRFVFGKNHGKLSFPKTYDTAIVSAGTNIVHFTPFPSSFQKQGGYGISIPGVFWSLEEDPLEKNKKRVLSSGTAPPKIKIKGTANQSVILKIECTLPGERGNWQFKYSTDNGKNYSYERSRPTVPINSSVDPLSATGLTLNIDEGKATTDNIWTADNTYSYFDPNKVDTVTKTILTEQKADTTSASRNTSLTWVVANTSTLLVDNGTCQNFSCTNSFFNGEVATTHQLAAIRIKGHEFDHDVYHRELDIESQRVVKIIGNTFDTFDVDAVIHSLIWGAKEIRIQNNVFVDSPFSQSIVHEPSADPFDTRKDHSTFDDKLKRWIPDFDKKAISKIVHLSGNTYVDVGRVYLGCGGLIKIIDETVIYSGKLSNPTTPHFYILTPPEHVNAYPGRVGRVIRRNNTISGKNPAKLYAPSTTSSNPMDPYPTWWSWHEGDREEIEVPGARNYSSYGFNGSTSTKEGHETELTVAWLPVGGSITDQFQAGAEISMKYWDSGEKMYKDVTWGGFPHVIVVAVDRTKGVGQVCARTALPADKEASNVGVLGPTPSYYGGRICTAPGTFGGCTAHATTSKGNYKITITDDVLTLCPQQIISIAGVTFTSPNVITEIVEVIGHEGHPGSIIVRDAPDQAVTGAAVSFVPPTLVLYDKIASTGVTGGVP
jgi:hypothetical protein